MSGVFEWLRDHAGVLWWLTASSVLTFLAALVLAPILVARIPDDYFAGTRRVHVVRTGRPFLVRAFVLVLKNVLGGLLVAVGVVLLFLPGQGILSILAGVMLLDFPGKFRLERWFISRRPVLRTVNWARRKAKRRPLIVDK